MDNQYLVIKRMNVAAANALSTYWVANGAPVTAAVMFAHALGLEHDFADEIDGVALVHHSSELHAEPTGKPFEKVQPHQRRGATYIDMKDYANKKSVSISLQPTMTRDLIVSIVIRIEDVDIDIDEIQKQLKFQRFAGGKITHFQSIDLLDSMEDVVKKIGVGFVVVDKTELLSDQSDPLKHAFALTEDRTLSLINLRKKLSLSEDKAKKFVDKLSTYLKKEFNPDDFNDDLIKKMSAELNEADIELINRYVEFYLIKKDNPWLAMTHLGYRMLEQASERVGARGAFDHAFSEALVGLVSHQTLRDFSLSELNNIFWSGQWKDHQTFTINQ